eukprot:CAMPEP_0170065526 /NCGR_PEP_ID=MMETSP0019_2-20121128/5574_1 /TAXON_ID=98059 /ORGANISM="Dinobryon sp., Strain UTEXLB2267" /LENGTH=197 /DNA_ID=CAMNT_0010272405 /DNA_START=549 /DNA_END=1142 /DNA_ORIENTATION=+
MIVLPLDTWKSTTENIRQYLFNHPISNQLKKSSGVIKLELSKEQLIWSSFGCRRDNCFRDREALSTANWRGVLLGLSDIPYWAKEHDEKDRTHGIIIKVSVYKDKIIFSIPAGKREVGETAWEAAVRETNEEVGIDIENNEIPSLWSIEHHFRLNPNCNGGESYLMSFNSHVGGEEASHDDSHDSHIVDGMSSLNIS